MRMPDISDIPHPQKQIFAADTWPVNKSLLQTIIPYFAQTSHMEGFTLHQCQIHTIDTVSRIQGEGTELEKSIMDSSLMHRYASRHIKS
ncbi:MAG: hypothetical protein K9J74_05290 [Sulfuritalea sp.]|nr:hypothetical protein [Sulfuritalea sp.]